MSGFTIVTSESMEAALTHARNCPFLDIGGSLEVSELVEMPNPMQAGLRRVRPADKSCAWLAMSMKRSIAGVEPAAVSKARQTVDFPSTAVDRFCLAKILTRGVTSVRAAANLPAPQPQLQCAASLRAAAK